jgi:cyclohexanone monooxygenase
MVHRDPDMISGTEMLDVLIVGAGLSGIGAAHCLQRNCPGKRYAILEARDRIGGTWDLFRYPGIRSDSDMYTLGYDFKPWTEAKAIADGPSILRYIKETADEAGIMPNIWFRHSVRSADWSSREACWTVTAERADGGGTATFRARFLYMCSGYYSYAGGHRPKFDGEAAFRGLVVDPQFWPEGLDYHGKRVVVIGSGATAVTIVPAMAEAASHVTMVQRSPTYVVTRPSEDDIARWLDRHLPSRVAYGLARWKNVLTGIFLYDFARRRPERVKKAIIELARKQVGPGCDVDTHFTPRYNPWDQRICLVPDGDLFRQIREGRASVVTDTIRRFTEKGLELCSGEEIEADIVVMATGLEFNVLGGISLRLDGRGYEPSRAIAYKGMMLSDVPNFAMTFGYTNASWTLKADLTAGYVCRLLRYMDRKGYAIATPRGDPSVLPEPFLSFTSGYVQRALARLPKQGSRRPWQVYQNYLRDLFAIRYGRIADGVMQFSANEREP